jgi:plasmid maintenance system killer protein
MVREFSRFRKVAERKLTMLDNASDLKDLVAPAGNHYSTTLPERQESKPRDSPSDPPRN